MQVTFVALEATQWSFVGDPPYVPVVQAAAVVTAAWLVPGLAARPGRSGLADDASEERTGLALFELMLFKSRFTPQRRSDRYVAGWRLLSGCNSTNSDQLWRSPHRLL